MGLRRPAPDRARPPGSRLLRPRGGLSRRAAWLRLGGLAVAIGALFALVGLSGSVSSERVRDWVDGFGLAGPLVFILLASCLTVVLFPGPLLAGASGLLFGTALGFPISLISATLGASMAFAVARFVAHDAVEQLSGPRLRRLQEWIERRGFYAVLYARLAPGVPYTLVNYAAGLSRVRYGAFVAATALGAAPRAFAYTALGGSLDDLSSPEAIVAVAVLVAMAVGAGIVAWRGRRPRSGEDRAHI